jgi:hypothetical protein
MLIDKPFVYASKNCCSTSKELHGSGRIGGICVEIDAVDSPFFGQIGPTAAYYIHMVAARYKPLGCFKNNGSGSAGRRE